LDHNETIADASVMPVPSGPVESGDSTPSYVTSEDARASSKSQQLQQKPQSH